MSAESVQTVEREAFREELLREISVPPWPSDGDDPWWAIAAAQPRSRDRSAPDQRVSGQKPGPAAWPDGGGGPPQDASREFVPPSPRTLEEAGLTASELEALVFKFLLNRGMATGREVARQLGLPFPLVVACLREAKNNLLVVYKNAAPQNDYLHELTETGHERARRYARQCTYFGTAPVALRDYVASVHIQSVAKQKPQAAQVRRALEDLVLSPEIVSQIGQAIVSGLGLFLYGEPGNGKTTIAERVSRAFGEGIWIPRAISVLGEIIRVYDPSCHTLLAPEPDQAMSEPNVDQRWVHIRRPTIVAGGELTMANLEVTVNHRTNICEAPLQMKANCGVLLIDDFGRQRASPCQLLNRWIVPLERRHDYLNLPNGRKIDVPFDELIIFATNMEPRDLVDEAFLRRIPYKINVTNPEEHEFRELFGRLASAMGVRYQEEVLDHLLAKHYRQANRPLRFCHPRDLLRQIGVYCGYYGLPLEATPQAIDAAVKNYFAIMEGGAGPPAGRSPRPGAAHRVPWPKESPQEG